MAINTKLSVTRDKPEKSVLMPYWNFSTRLKATVPYQRVATTVMLQTA